MSNFYQRVREASTPRETKQDVISYFKEQYPGSKTDSKGRSIENWRVKVAEARMAINPTLTRNTALRPFQGKRAESTKVTAQMKAEYAEIGSKLPPIPPENGFHITGEVWVKYSTDCEPRDIDIDISGADAKRLVNMAIADMIQAVVNGYQSDEEDKADIDFKGPDWCAEPDLDVVAL